MELQRRALELSAEKGAARDDPERVPLWAQISKLQALQSLARKAPSDKTLRASIYDLNIPQVWESSVGPGCILLVVFDCQGLYGNVNAVEFTYSRCLPPKP